MRLYTSQPAKWVCIRFQICLEALASGVLLHTNSKKYPFFSTSHTQVRHTGGLNLAQSLIPAVLFTCSPKFISTIIFLSSPVTFHVHLDPPNSSPPAFVRALRSKLFTFTGRPDQALFRTRALFFPESSRCPRNHAVHRFTPIECKS